VSTGLLETLGSPVQRAFVTRQRERAEAAGGQGERGGPTPLEASREAIKAALAAGASFDEAASSGAFAADEAGAGPAEAAACAGEAIGWAVLAKGGTKEEAALQAAAAVADHSGSVEAQATAAAQATTRGGGNAAAAATAAALTALDAGATEVEALMCAGKATKLALLAIGASDEDADKAAEIAVHDQRGLMLHGGQSTSWRERGPRPDLPSPWRAPWT
jgi:hypothetical protein